MEALYSHKKIIMRYLMLFIFFVNFLSCKDEECQIVGEYEFVLPAILTPAKDTFRVGDTITILSQFSDSIYERKTDQLYLVEDFKWYPEVFIYPIDTMGQYSDLSFFDFVITPEYDFDLFRYIDGSTSLYGQYRYNNHEYQLEYKIIPVQPGLFYLSHGSSIYGLGEDQDFEGRCSNTNVGAVVEMNGRGDNNGDLFLSSPDEIYHEFWQMKRDKFYDFGGYCFYVKE